MGTGTSVELNRKVALIDLEFTGLDNSVVTDNEIIQVKIKNVETELGVLKNFWSKKALSAYTQLEHKVERYDQHPLFSLHELTLMLEGIGLSLDSIFYGFGVQQDIKMLSKYGCEIEINDIRTHFQQSSFAYRMATEGSSLEATYLIVTGKFPENINHADYSEMNLISELYREMGKHKAESFMQIVPFGHCAGMAIAEYVEAYRRAADGYRYNNKDAFSDSLSHFIQLQEDAFDDEYPYGFFA